MFWALASCRFIDAVTERIVLSPSSGLTETVCLSETLAYVYERTGRQSPKRPRRRVDLSHTLLDIIVMNKHAIYCIFLLLHSAVLFQIHYLDQLLGAQPFLTS